jgi:hypothetical protein
MGCLGVHFSLSADEVQAFRDIEESERVDYLSNVVEEKYFAEQPERKAESDKAWDAMHRTLSDGDLAWDGGDYPLNHVVLGGERLYHDSDYIMVLKTPEQVRDVAAAILDMTEPEFRRRYFAIDTESYGLPVDEEDFGYTWGWFEGVHEFWMRAASEGRYVLFTASQ